jgi:hypothetical protein
LHQVIAEDTWDETWDLQKQVQERIVLEQQRWKHRYGSGHSRSIKYNMEGIVFLRKPLEANGESTKLQPKYRGPLVVTEALPSDVYRVSGLHIETGADLEHIYGGGGILNKISTW